MGASKRFITILFAILAFAGMIGLIIACLNVIPNGDGETAWDEIVNNHKPADTTTPSGDNETPDQVDLEGGEIWVYNETKDIYELASYAYEYEQYPVTVGSTTKNYWRGPILKFKVDNVDLLYQITFDVSDVAYSGNIVSYYSPSGDTWESVRNMINGTFYGVAPDDNGYIYLILVDDDFLTTDQSYYENVADRMEEYGYTVHVTYDSTVAG